MARAIRESIRANHSQLKPLFLWRVRPIRTNHSNFRFARITRFARIVRIDSRESRHEVLCPTFLSLFLLMNSLFFFLPSEDLLVFFFFFERFSFLFQGFFEGFGSNKRSLFFWWFSLFFFQKKRKGRTMWTLGSQNPPL